VYLCRLREWEKNLEKPFLGGETDSPEPATGVTGCDGLHVTGGDGLDAGDGQVGLKGYGQPVTGCDGRHPEAQFFRTCSFLRFLAEFRRFCAWRPLLLCT